MAKKKTKKILKNKSSKDSGIKTAREKNDWSTYWLQV